MTPNVFVALVGRQMHLEQVQLVVIQRKQVHIGLATVHLHLIDAVRLS